MRSALAFALSLGALFAVSLIALSLVTTCACAPGVPNRPHPVVRGEGASGEPGQNTSTIWTGQITSVTAEKPHSDFTVSLLAGPEGLIDPVPLRTGRLGTLGDLEFAFFDRGIQCLPTPCPPPEGPDGLLGVGDYFRLSNTVPGTSYEVVIIWAASGATVGSIAIQT